MVSVKYCILGVEGPHDQAFVGRLLSMYGLKEFKGELERIDLFWKKFIPNYPRTGKKLYERLDMPSIFFSPTHSIAVYQGEGDNLCRNLKDKMGEHDPYIRDIHAFGLVVDADTYEPRVALKNKAKDLHKLFPALTDEVGIIVDGKPRLGTYVLPDNDRTGILDSILIKCASIVYPELKKGAERFLTGLDEVHKNHWKQFQDQKALVACIVSVLRPGMANTPSIAQDNWICSDTFHDVEEVAQLSRFLEDLLELTNPNLAVTTSPAT